MKKSRSSRIGPFFLCLLGFSHALQISEQVNMAVTVRSQLALRTALATTARQQATLHELLKTRGGMDWLKRQYRMAKDRILTRDKCVRSRKLAVALLDKLHHRSYNMGSIAVEKSLNRFLGIFELTDQSPSIRQRHHSTRQEDYDFLLSVLRQESAQLHHVSDRFFARFDISTNLMVTSRTGRLVHFWVE